MVKKYTGLDGSISDGGRVIYNSETDFVQFVLVNELFDYVESPDDPEYEQCWIIKRKKKKEMVNEYDEVRSEMIFTNTNVLKLPKRERPDNCWEQFKPDEERMKEWRQGKQILARMWCDYAPKPSSALPYILVCVRTNLVKDGKVKIYGKWGKPALFCTFQD